MILGRPAKSDELTLKAMLAALGVGASDLILRTKLAQRSSRKRAAWNWAQTGKA
jgi:hypothetical protein